MANEVILLSFRGGEYDARTLVLVDAPGTAVLAFAVYDSNQIELFSVRSPHRGQGHGKTLAQHVVDEIRQSSRGWSRVYLECNPESSVPFWTSLGFSRIPRRPGIWMQLPIRG